jgi:hypothetical protein
MKVRERVARRVSRRLGRSETLLAAGAADEDGVSVDRSDPLRAENTSRVSLFVVGCDRLSEIGAASAKLPDAKHPSARSIADLVGLSWNTSASRVG